MKPFTISFEFSLIPEVLTICHLSPKEEIPDWALNSSFYSISKTPTELSIVCDSRYVPKDIRCEGNWRGFHITGTLDFTLTGILASLTDTLARAGIPVFAISTFDTDYLLVKSDLLSKAKIALSDSGHRFL